MNLLLKASQFDLSYIYFLDKKINIIMDGFFTKICFSDEYISLNGVFLISPFTNYHKQYYQKNFIQFDVNANREFINRLSTIEKQIIQYYTMFYGITNKTPVFNLKTQLQNGYIKYYVEYYGSNKGSYYIKISGVWESQSEIGITYKIIEY